MILLYIPTGPPDDRIPNRPGQYDLKKFKAQGARNDDLSSLIVTDEKFVGATGGDHQCIPNAKPAAGCVCKQWTAKHKQSRTENNPSNIKLGHIFEDGVPQGACCMNPKGDSVSPLGYCHCVNGGVRDCVCGNGPTSYEHNVPCHYAHTQACIRATLDAVADCCVVDTALCQQCAKNQHHTSPITS